MQFDQPGCFGFASTYNVKSKVCGQCQFSEQCSKTALAALQQLSATLNVDAVMKMAHEKSRAPERRQNASKAELPPACQKILATMPKHVAKVAELLLRSGKNYRKALIDGRNLLDVRPAPLSKLFDLMLQGGVDRQTYIDSLKADLGYTDGTAASQASIGYSVVIGLGIGKLNEGKLVIRGDK